MKISTLRKHSIFHTLQEKFSEKTNFTFYLRDIQTHLFGYIPKTHIYFNVPNNVLYDVREL